MFSSSLKLTSNTYRRRNSSASCLLEALNDEDQTKLSQCLEVILDIVGESMPEVQGMIKLFLVIYMCLGEISIVYVILKCIA